jgi:hypothetical protein
MATNTHVIFEKGIMASTQLDTHVKSVKAPADLDNGSIVEITGLETGEADYYTCTAPSAVTTDSMYIVDAIKRPLFQGKYALDFIQDVREFYTPSGYSARVRKLAVGDSCYISNAGINGTAVLNQYLIPANGAYTLAPSANLSGGTLIAFKVIKAHTFYVGTETVSGWRLECVVA